MRAALRALGWVISELIPAQALRVAMNRDYHRVLAERDFYKHRAEFLVDVIKDSDAMAERTTYTVEEVFAERDRLWDERPAPMEMFDRIRAEAQQDSSPVAPENPTGGGDSPTPAEPAPAAPGVGPPSTFQH